MRALPTAERFRSLLKGGSNVLCCTGPSQGIEYLLDHPEESQRAGTTARRRSVKPSGASPIVDARDRLYRKIIFDWRAWHEGPKGTG